MTINPYEILGLDETATEGKIKKTYRSLSKKVHPDQGGSHEKFLELRRAYTVLSDSDRRNHYDATGEIDEEGTTLFQDQVVGEIAKLFELFLKNNQTFEKEVDIIGSMRQVVENNLSEKRQTRVRMEDYREKILGLAKRISREGEEPNLFTGILKNKEKELDEMIAEREKASRLLIAINEELASYTCLTEMVQVFNAIWSGNTTSGATTGTGTLY